MSAVKVESLVCGYLRSMEEIIIKTKYLPKGIKNMIKEFCKSWFKWNDCIHEKQMKNFILNNDNPYKLKNR